MTDTQEIWASVRALHDAYYDSGTYTDGEVERHFRNIEKRLMGVNEHPPMNLYKITVRTDAAFVIEAETEGQAREQALENFDEDFNSSFCFCDSKRSMVEVKNLTDPVWLIAELAMHLEEEAFKNEYEICRFCAGPRAKHAPDCIIELARHYISRKE